MRLSFDACEHVCVWQGSGFKAKVELMSMCALVLRSLFQVKAEGGEHVSVCVIQLLAFQLGFHVFHLGLASNCLLFLECYML